MIHRKCLSQIYISISTLYRVNHTYMCPSTLVSYLSIQISCSFALISIFCYVFKDLYRKPWKQMSLTFFAIINENTNKAKGHFPNTNNHFAKRLFAITWTKESTSDRNLVRSPLSHLIEVGTLGTTTPPGKKRSLVCLASIWINLDLQPENLISLHRS